jgi:Leucine-rich repeat (LRR) protein
MSRYLYGFFWSNGIEQFDFIYTYKDDVTQYKCDIKNLNNIDVTKLSTIEIHNVEVESIYDKFCELPCNTIIINNCKIGSIENLNINKTIKKMIITDSDIKNIKKLENMNIENLTIINTKNIDIDEVLVFKNLIELTYKSNIINFIANFECLEKLKILNLSNNKIKDITNMGIMTNLCSLDLSHNDIENIDILEKYDKLKYLYINNNQIKNIYPIRNNCNIKFLNISNNNIENIDFIYDFEELEILNVSNNKIIYLPDLMKLKKLDFENLKVSWNNIKDMKGMKGFGLIKNIIKTMVNNK